eukprot:2073415-Alexandrium_andersonii.AAC.1
MHKLALRALARPHRTAAHSCPPGPARCLTGARASAHARSGFPRVRPAHPPGSCVRCLACAAVRTC